jgi:hypothetical protein
MSSQPARWTPHIIDNIHFPWYIAGIFLEVLEISSILSTVCRLQALVQNAGAYMEF